jgi:hypothetical protein
MKTPLEAQYEIRTISWHCNSIGNFLGGRLSALSYCRRLDSSTSSPCRNLGSNPLIHWFKGSVKGWSVRTFEPEFSIRKISRGCARSAKRPWLAACRLKSNNERAGRTVSIAGSSSVTTHSETKRDVWCAGMRREPTSMIASAPKTGHVTKTLRCAKRSYAHPCSRKSSVPPSHCAECWFKFRRWLLPIPRSWS